ncbi:MAG: hypothetical protein RPT25_04570, partial [Cycloclasticus sp.]
VLARTQQYLAANEGLDPKALQIGTKVTIPGMGEVSALEAGVRDSIISRHVYGDNNIPLPDGVAPVSDAQLDALGINRERFSSESGFGGDLYYDSARESYIFANKGTEAKWNDAGADVSQAFGMATAQYEEAVKLADYLDERLPNNITFTGHSLGGGLASAQALRIRSSANTFNAAGLHQDTMERLNIDGRDSSAINAYFVSGEILSSTQDSMAVDIAAFGFTVPKNAIELGTEVGSWFTGNEHDANYGIAYTPEAVGNRIEVAAVNISENKASGVISYGGELTGFDKFKNTASLHGSAYVVGSMQYFMDRSGQ